jgi:hypothetical protein
MNERGASHGERGHLSVKVCSGSSYGIATFGEDGVEAYETQAY